VFIGHSGALAQCLSFNEFKKDEAMKKQPEIKIKESKKIIMKNTKIFFSKETERKCFFFMTMIMLLMGVLVKFF
jgi:hypothetical protein